MNYKTFFALAAFLVLFCTFFAGGFYNITYAVDKPNDDAEQQLSQSISDQLKDLNLDEVEKILSGLDTEEANLFGAKNFLQKVESVVNGDFKIGYDSFFSALLGLAFKNTLNFLPIMASIIGICVLSNILLSIRAKSTRAGVGSVVYLACYGVIVIIIFASAFWVITITKNSIISMQAQMNAVFPVLITLMTALGANASAAVYQPAIALLSSGIMQLLTVVVLPIFIFGIVLSFVGNISSNIKLNKLSSFFFSTAKWLIGIVFAVFLAFLAVQGITASTYDGVSVRTAKYALSHYIPIVGGYLSEGFNLILAGSMLIKNAIGLSAIILLAVTILSPLITITVFSLCLKLTAAIVEPICDEKISAFLSSVSKNMAMLAAIIIAIAFMYFIIVLLVVCTGNYTLSGG